MKHDKVLIRLDGSRRLTARNRQFVKQIVPPVSEDRVAIGMYDEEVSGGDDVVLVQTDDLRGHQAQHDDPAELVAGDRPSRVRRPNVRYNADEYDLSHVFVSTGNGFVRRYVKAYWLLDRHYRRY